MPAQPVLTSSGAVIDQVTTGVGALVVEEISADGSWRYLGRLRTGGIGLPAALDVIDATHFVLPASDGIWVSDDAAKTWHFVSSGIDLADLGSMSLLLNGSQQITGIILAESDSGTGSDPTAVALRTNDGGRSWQSVGSALAVDPYVGEPRYDLLAFPSPRVGYVAGAGGLSVTDDGGRTWRSELGMSEPIQQLDVEGTGDSVVLSSDSLLTTSDGGSHWRLASEPAAGALYSVSFVGAGVGYGVVCESNDPSLQNTVVALVRTTDDGKSWRVLPVPPGFTCTAISNGKGTPPSELCAASPEVLYAIAGPLVERPGMMLPQPTILFRSLDGGRSWSRVAGISDAGIVSCDGDTLWTVVEQSFRSNSAYAVRYSSDGGRHFRSLIGATSGTSTYADIGLQGVQMKHAAGMFGSIATPTTSSALDEIRFHTQPVGLRVEHHVTACNERQRTSLANRGRVPAVAVTGTLNHESVRERLQGLSLLSLAQITSSGCERVAMRRVATSPDGYFVVGTPGSTRAASFRGARSEGVQTVRQSCMTVVFMTQT
jgi:photosystem II stability/assembly factor-like uncharacterized protein